MPALACRIATIMLVSFCSCVCAVGQEANSDQKPPDNWTKFHSQLRELQKDYGKWSLQETTQHFVIGRNRKWRDTFLKSVDQIELSDFVSAEPGLKKSALQKVNANRIAVSGDLFRYDSELLESNVIERVESCWDGHVLRSREAGRSSNEKFDSINTALERGPKRFPHIAVSQDVLGNVRSEVGQILRSILGLSYVFNNSSRRAVQVSSEVMNGEPCWRIHIKHDASLRFDATIWFARERNLLPIRVETDYELLLIDGFQDQSVGDNKSRHFPRRVIWLNQRNEAIRVTSIKVLADENDPTVFSTIDLTRPAMLKIPPAQTVGQTSAAPLPAAPPINRKRSFSNIYEAPPQPRPSDWYNTFYFAAVCVVSLVIAWVFARIRRLRRESPEASAWRQSRSMAFIGVSLTCIALAVVAVADAQWRAFAIVALIVCIPIAWRIHNKAEATDVGEPNYRVRTIAGIVGVILTLATLIALSMVRSWGEHGVAIAAAGLFGLLWIAMMKCFMRNMRFSLATILCLSACVAMLLSGLQKASREIRTRQAMMDSLNADPDAMMNYRNTVWGNSFWVQTPGGLQMPRSLAREFGNAALGVVRKATIPRDKFTSRTLGQWNLDHTTSIDVVARSETSNEAPYVVPVSAINAIPLSARLQHFACDGVLDDKAVDSLKRFKSSLRHLAFSTAQNAVPPALLELRSLEYVGINDARIDAAVTELLAKLPTQTRIVLANPTFTEDALSAKAFPNQSIHLGSANIDQTMLDWISKSQQTEILWHKCRIDPGVDLSAIKTLNLSIYSTQLSDKHLMTLSDSLQLETVILSRTAVTPKGFDAFSKRSGASIVLE